MIHRAERKWAAAAANEKAELETIYDKATDSRKRIEKKFSASVDVVAKAAEVVKLHTKSLEKQKGKARAVTKLAGLTEADPKHKGTQREILEWTSAFEIAEKKVLQVFHQSFLSVWLGE